MFGLTIFLMFNHAILNLSWFIYNTMAFLYANRLPVAYGAIMYNGTVDGTSSCYPVFTSLSNLAALTSISDSGSGTIDISDVDDYWIVMPGYKIVVYSLSGYTGTLLLTGDNSTGASQVTFKISSPNNASSIQLYFRGTLIAQPA
jgi:hypothetical protein